jgi:hypothetical protein
MGNIRSKWEGGKREQKEFVTLYLNPKRPREQKVNNFSEGISFDVNIFPIDVSASCETHNTVTRYYFNDLLFFSLYKK